MNLQQISYIRYSGAAFPLTCCIATRGLLEQMIWAVSYDEENLIQMQYELYNTLPNRSLALLPAGPDLGDKIYKPGL